MKGVHRVDLGQWPPALFVIGERRAYQRFMRAHCGGKAADHPPFPAPNGGHCQKLVQDRACIFLIVVGEQRNRDELAITLAHEATHAMRWLFEHIDEKRPGTEAESYLVEHIVRGGLKAFAP
jgi:hypothetical protein